MEEEEEELRWKGENHSTMHSAFSRPRPSAKTTIVSLEGCKQGRQFEHRACWCRESQLPSPSSAPSAPSWDWPSLSSTLHSSSVAQSARVSCRIRSSVWTKDTGKPSYGNGPLLIMVIWLQHVQCVAMGTDRLWSPHRTSDHTTWGSNLFRSHLIVNENLASYN